MLLWGLLFSVIILNAVFGRTIFGIDARKILFVLVLLFVGYVLYFSLFHKEMYELLIENERITVVRTTVQSELTFPLYGKNDQYYYVIYPAIHHRIALINNCPGFRANNIDTWCGDARVQPRCNTPEQPENCLIKYK
jgi:hypothetical protein